MAAKRCKVCLASPDVLARTNALLDSNVKLATIVSDVGFNVFQLSRHKNRCVLKPLNGQATDGSEMDIWMRRLDEAHNQAIIDGNLGARISAISAAGRALERARKLEVAKADDELPDKVSDWSPQQGMHFTKYLDHVVKQATENAKPGSAVDEMNWLHSLRPETLAMFRRLTENTELYVQVQEFIARQLPQRPLPEETNNAHDND